MFHKGKKLDNEVFAAMLVMMVQLLMNYFVLTPSTIPKAVLISKIMLSFHSLWKADNRLNFRSQKNWSFFAR